MKKSLILLLLVFSIIIIKAQSVQEPPPVEEHKKLEFSKKTVDYKSCNGRPAVGLAKFLDEIRVESFIENVEQVYPDNLFPSGLRNWTDAYFLPTKYTDGTPIEYATFDDIKRDQVLREDINSDMHWTLEKDNILIADNLVFVDNPENNNCKIHFGYRNAFYLKGVGEYRIKVKIQEKCIFEFVFTLNKMENTNRLADKNFKTFYYVEGIWDKMPYLQFNEFGALELIKFSRYVDLETKTGVKISPETYFEKRSLHVFAELYFEGKLISNPLEKDPKTNQLVLNGRFRTPLKRFTFEYFVRSFDQKGTAEPIKAGDLKDGNYTIKLYTSATMEDSFDKNPTINNYEYKFSIKGKQIVPIPEQTDAFINDPLKYIESFEKHYFLK